MLMSLWPGYLGNRLESMEMRLDEDNSRYTGTGKVRIRKFRRFSRNELWKNIGCLIRDPAFGLGGLRLRKKGEE